MTNLEFQVQMVEYNILVAEQCASRLAEEFWKETQTGTFINFGRISIAHSFHHQVVNQPNEFFQMLVERTFRNRLKELEKAHARV